jgi:hypothetical protein
MREKVALFDVKFLVYLIGCAMVMWLMEGI